MKNSFKTSALFCALTIFLTLFAQTSSAHFGMVIPSDSMVMQTDDRTVTVTISFSHPFEMVGMELAKPKAFDVIKDGKKNDLLGSIVKTQLMDHTAWKTEYAVRRPGVYVFAMEPSPYWEPAEDCFIIHYTKAVVTAFEDDEGWDAETGVKTEIVPLSKPFGLYAGNVFQGVVKLDGAPVPFAEVEIEFYNRDKAVEAPTSYMITQAIKADANGIFTYAAPAPGWWGFSALNSADFKLEKDGVMKDVELGAVIWVHFEKWKAN
jgi:cobalt/nickel transport protein